MGRDSSAEGHTRAPVPSVPTLRNRGDTTQLIRLCKTSPS